MIEAYAALSEKGPLEPFTYEPGELKASEVEIAVHSCGICHSDVSMIENDWGLAQYPLVPGHEVIGEIRALGPCVQNLERHQMVGLGWHAGYCQSCEMCQQADYNLCAQSQPTIVGHHGGFAKVVRADARSVVPIPDGVDYSKMGPLLCGGITVFNPLVQFNVKPTHRVAVIGVGGLGHMAIQFLHAWGCHVTAFTTSADKAKECMELGADCVIHSEDTDALEAAANSFDFMLSTVNVPLPWDEYLATLRPHGRLHFVGAVLEPLQFSLFPMLMKQLSISSSPVGSPQMIRKMLTFAKQHEIAPFVEKFAMCDVNEALAHLKAGKARYRLVLEN
tara:strand:- start:2060 stop:3061 length:1002 start_codon:yes stop_codon:yes gene_type:complete